MIYLDNLLILNKAIEEHWKALNTVFACLAKHWLYLRPDKYALLLKHIDFLSHFLDTSGVYM